LQQSGRLHGLQSFSVTLSPFYKRGGVQSLSASLQFSTDHSQNVFKFLQSLEQFSYGVFLLKTLQIKQGSSDKLEVSIHARWFYPYARDSRRPLL